MTTHNISIPRDYFDTLPQRADLVRPQSGKAQDQKLTTLAQQGDADSVTIPSSEYKSLVCCQFTRDRLTDFQLQSAREYQSLRTALLAGGVPLETLDILINASLPASPIEGYCESKSAEGSSLLSKSPRGSPSAADTKLRSISANWRSGRPVLPTPTTATDGEEHEEHVGGHENDEDGDHEVYYDNDYEDRSLVLKGLPPLTTLADITEVVRGGMLLNVFLRPRDRTAHVTFVQPTAAERFLIHSQRNDLYIKGKRVDVFWDERQHYLPGYVARRVGCNGASRNLVVRFAQPNMTADSIREDLDHIHRLEIISIMFEGGHAYISTNSIARAITARTCLLSRFKYKDSRIEFYPDECDQPLPRIAEKKSTRQTPPSDKAATFSRINRYALLADPTQDDDDAE